MTQIETENAYQVSYCVVVCHTISLKHSYEALTTLQVGEGLSAGGQGGPQVGPGVLALSLLSSLSSGVTLGNLHSFPI